METIKWLVKNNDWKHPGYCLNHRTNICEKRKDWVCSKCTEDIFDILKMHHSKISLENWCKLNQRQQFEYFFHNQLWRKNWYKNYSPRLRNILSSDQNLSKLKYNDLELWHIYEVFEKFISDMIQRYKTEHDLWAMEDNSFLKDFYKSDSVSDFVHYNILDRNFSFRILDEDIPKNTLFSNYQEDIKLLMGSNGENSPKISDIMISINNQNIPINSIPEYYIKTKWYNSLSEQIEDIIDKSKEWKDEIDETNLKSIEEYLKVIQHIEGLTKSSKYLADNHTINILNKRKEKMNKWWLRKEDITIATNKNPNRATEKIIKDYDWDLEKLRDVSRASMVFDTPLDLVSWAIEFVEMLDKYNKSELDENKKVTDIKFISKFWYPRTISKKNSGYRDAKFLIKLWNENVIEIQLHIRDILISKYQWVKKIRNKHLLEIVSALKFTTTEYEQINEIIDSIDRDRSEKPKPKYFDKLEYQDILSSDQIYSIYRLLNTYDRNNNKKTTRNLSERSLLEKLQYLEKEINNEWYRLMIDKMFGMFSDKEKKTKREKIITSLDSKKN